MSEVWTKAERDTFLDRIRDQHSDDETVVKFCDRVEAGGQSIGTISGWKRDGERGRKLGPHEHLLNKGE